MGVQVTVVNKTQSKIYLAEHALSDRQVEIVLAGGLINHFRQQFVL
jgi:hypothetical protein